MKTGAQIVAELEASEHEDIVIQTHDRYLKHWPTIRAALLAYEPKSALRTILDRMVKTGDGNYYCTPDELSAARAELDELEHRPERNNA